MVKLLDALFIAGGVIVTAVTVVSVVRAMRPPKEEIPPEEIPPLPGIPVAIMLPAAPIPFTQYYGLVVETGWAWDKPFGYQHLHVPHYTDFSKTVEGWGSVAVKGKVVDAAGRGVPGLTVDVWHSSVPDIHGGSLTIDGNVHTEAKPIRVVTDQHGEFVFAVGYRFPEIKLAELGAKLQPLGTTPTICRRYALPYTWITVTPVLTYPAAYTVTAAVVGPRGYVLYGQTATNVNVRA